MLCIGGCAAVLKFHFMKRRLHVFVVRISFFIFKRESFDAVSHNRFRNYVRSSQSFRVVPTCGPLRYIINSGAARLLGHVVAVHPCGTLAGLLGHVCSGHRWGTSGRYAHSCGV